MTTETETNVEPSSGLLDSVQVADESKTENPQAVEIDHKTTTAIDLAPGTIPGTPKERPDWLPENFWNQDKGEANMEAMAKSYADLRKVVSQGKHKAPEGGKYDTAALGVKDIEADPLAKQYVGWAQKYGISQVAFDELAQNVNQMAAEMAGPPIDTQAEMKSLGPNANAVVNGMVDWARGLVNKGVWSKDDFEEFKIMGGTARGLGALMKVRSAYEGRVPIEVVFEGAKLDVYKLIEPKEIKTINLDEIKESFCYLFVGHWMQGDFGHDRKNVSLLIITIISS